MLIRERGLLCVSGPRLTASGLHRIKTFAYSTPYEDGQWQSACVVW